MPTKLLVVSGPNKGATYFLEDGDCTIGRDEACQIVLSSGQVSKRHITLHVSNSGRRVELEDLGSSNGTFVNGVLAKKKILQAKDRISVGPFVLEALLPAALPAVRKNTMAAPATMNSMSQSYGMGNADAAIGAAAAPTPAAEEPKSLLGKMRHRFDDIVLPVLYDFYEKYDFPTILVVMFIIFVVINVGLTVYPVLDRSHEEVLREAESRALYIANQIANVNHQNIMEGREANVTVDFTEGEANVLEALVLNLDGRILAPGTRLNEMYNSQLFLHYKDDLVKGMKYWGKPFRHRSENSTTYFVPIMVLSKTRGINVPGAVAAVVFSTSSVALDSATEASIYFETISTTGMVGVVFLYLLYQLTFQPIRMLNDELDRALRGEVESVGHKYKSEIIERLVDSINSALSRVSKGNASTGADTNLGSEQEQTIANNWMHFMEGLAAKVGSATLLLDNEMRIRFSNPVFEELTGIRGGVGDVLENVSRDEAFPSLIKELAERALSAGNDGVFENYDFNSGQHKILALALAGTPNKADGYLFLFEKLEG